jgi:hypothetical protein
MKSEILVVKATAYNYVDKISGLRKQGGEVTYLTGNAVAEPWGTNLAAGLEVITMFADFRCFARLENDLPCYAEAEYEPMTRRDAAGNDMITLRMVDVRVLGPASIGPDRSGDLDAASASRNGLASTPGAVPAK